MVGGIIGAFVGFALTPLGIGLWDVLVLCAIGCVLGRQQLIINTVNRELSPVETPRPTETESPTERPQPTRLGVAFYGPSGAKTVSVVPEPVNSEPPVEPTSGTVAKIQVDTEKAVVSVVPGRLAKQATMVKNWLTTGNVPVKVGVLVSLVGMGLLIREATIRGFLTIETRLGGLTVLALLMVFGGWKTRHTRRVFGLTIQGGGIAALYLVCYAVFGVYELLPSWLGGPAVVGVSVAAVVLAVTQDAMVLAVMGIVGGAVAPALVYTQPGDHVLIFGFYAALSVATAVIIWFKKWHQLAVVSWYMVLPIAATWLWVHYNTDDWTKIQPFLAVIVLTHVMVPLITVRYNKPAVGDAWTRVLLFGVPFSAVFLQYLLVGHLENGAAWSVLGLATVHTGLWLLVRRWDAPLATWAYAALAVGFAVMTVPFAFDVFYTSVAWVAQGAVLVWWGSRLGNRYAVWGGAALQLVAGQITAFLLLSRFPYEQGELVIANRQFLSVAAVTAAGFVSAWAVHRRRSVPFHDGLTWAGVTWATLWWIVGGLVETSQQAPEGQTGALMVVFVVVSLSVGAFIGKLARWSHLTTMGWLILPTAAVWVLSPTGLAFDGVGWGVWAVTIGCFYWVFHMWKHVNYPATWDTYQKEALHMWRAIGWFLTAGVVSLGTLTNIDSVAEGMWHLVAFVAVWLAFVAVPLVPTATRLFGKHIGLYQRVCSRGALIVASATTSVIILMNSGNIQPLPYLPLFNTTIVLAVLCGLGWITWAKRTGAPKPKVPPLMILATVGVVASTEIARTFHHWFGVNWDVNDVMSDPGFQVALSVAWAIVGLSGMVAGARMGHRAMWIAAGAVMAGVVGKLFLVDLSSLSATSRTVSFLVVGGLMILVGYLAPVPPPSKQ